MRNRWTRYAVMLLALALFAYGCGDGADDAADAPEDDPAADEPDTDDADGDEPDAEADDADAEADDAEADDAEADDADAGEQVDVEEMELVFAHTVAEASPVQSGAERFKEIVEERTGGAVTVETFPASQLGGENELVEGLDLGTVDVAAVGGALFANFCAPLGVFSLPYVIQGDSQEEQYDNLLALTDSELNETLVEDCAAERGYRVIDNSWWYGNRHLTSNTPVEVPEDVEGLRIRTPPADLHTAAIAAFGAEVVPMDFPEVYTALETGTLDGQENPINTIYENAFAEVQDYVQLTGHMTQNQTVVMSEATFTGLSPELQDLVLEAITEAGVDQSELQIQANDEDLGSLEEQGMEVIEPDLGPFEEATQDVVDDYLEQHGITEEELFGPRAEAEPSGETR